MNLREMLSVKKNILDQIAPFQEALAQIEEQISAAIADPVKEAMAKAKKDTGTVKFAVDGVDVKATLTKTVKWDQEKLGALFARILGAGDNPLGYIKVEYSVGETAYKAWPEAIQKTFLPAREVKPGKPKFEFHVNEDATPPWEEKEERAA